MKKRIISFLLALVMVLGMLPMTGGVEVAEAAMSGSDIEKQISETYKKVRSDYGGSFNGYCGAYVNYQLVELGINRTYVAGNGNVQYDNYKNLSKTTGGFTVEAYPASGYSLSAALNAISQNGSRDVYNILIGFEKGTGGPGSAGDLYGHTVFIHAILGGIIYFSESFSFQNFGGKAYGEGDPIVCSISTFCSYYGVQMVLDGVIHFASDADSGLFKRELPSYCKLKTTGATSIMSLPCSKATDPESTQVTPVSKGYDKITAHQLVLNSAGNYWYKVKTDDGAEGYIPSSKVKVTEMLRDAEVVGKVNPPSYTQDSSYSYTLQGTIKTTLTQLTDVSVWIYRGTEDISGEGVTGLWTPVYKNEYPLAGSDVDRATKFGNLTPGTYTYVVRAAWNNYYAASEKVLASDSDTHFVDVIQRSTFTVSAKNDTPLVQSTLPSYCKVQVTASNAHVKSLPCSEDSDPSSITVAYPEKGHTFTAIGLVLNRYGNYWYKVALAGGKEGYLYAGDGKMTEMLRDVKITGQTNPPDMNQGGRYTIQGTISAQYNQLTNVSAYIYAGTDTSSGKEVTGSWASVSGNSYTLANSSIDMATYFNNLTPGSYTYVVRAEWKNYYATAGKVLASDANILFSDVLQTSTFKVSGSHSHSWTREFDSKNHWEQCWCGSTRNVAAHSSWWTDFDDANHWKTCGVCGACTEDEKHSYSGGICSVCDHEWPYTVTNITATKYSIIDEAGAWTRPYEKNSTNKGNMPLGTVITVVAKTKNQAGNTWYKMENGLWVYSGNLGCATHTFSNWTVTSKPSYTSTGTEKRTCSVCGYAETRDMDKKVLGTPSVTISTTKSCGDPKLTWKKVTDAEKYEVYRATSSNGTYTKLKTVTELNYTDSSSRTVGTTYYYKVRAVIGNVYSDYSAVKSHKYEDHAYTGGICDNCNYEWPYTVTDIPATKYSVIDPAGAWTRPYSTNSTNTGGIPLGTVITVVAKTKNQAGNTWYKMENGLWVYSGNLGCATHAFSDWSVTSKPSYTSTGTEKRTCSACGYAETRDVDKKVLGVPTITEASKPSCEAPVLQWETVKDAEKYEIWRATSSGGEYERIYTATTTKFTNTSAEFGRTYYYKVRAVVGSVYGEFSAVVSRTYDHTAVIDRAEPGTCTVAGKTEGAHCAECGFVLIAQEPILPGGHHFEDGICTACGIPEVTYLLGDVNMDGSVDSMDTNILFRYASEDPTLGALTAEQLLVADANQDGSVDSMDTNILFRYANEDATLTWTPVEIQIGKQKEE